MGSKWRMSAEEINCLIYAYLQDSGFLHSSYALRHEARLDFSRHVNTPLRRGELVDLLSKALLYTEVETHWNMDPNSKCFAPFSLLSPHRCTFDATDRQPSQPPSPYQSTRPELFPYTNGSTYSSSSTAQKRKASSLPFEDNRSEKRICVTEDVDMHLVAGVEKNTGDEKMGLSSNNVAVTVDGVERVRQKSNRAESSEVSTESTAQVKKTLHPVVLLHGHEAEVFASAWNPVFSDLLATGSKDASARIWSWKNVQSKIEEGTNSPQAVIPQFQVSHPEPIILSHSEKSDEPDITSLDWSPDGNLLASGSFDFMLRVWSKDGEVYMIQTRHSGPIVSVQFSPNGKYLLSAGLDGVVCVWNMVSRILHIEFHIESKCLDVDWLDDSTFVTCSSSQNIRLVSIYPDDAFRTIIRSDQTLRIFTGHTGEVNQVKFNKDRSFLASCSDDNTARIWTREAWTNTEGYVITTSEPNMTCEAKVTLFGHTSSVGAIRWCPTKGNDPQVILATCSFDKTARLWDASNGSCLRILDGSSQSLFSITFDPTGHYLATGSEDGYLYIYDTATGQNIWRWPTSGPGAGPIYDVNWEQIHGSHLAMCLKSKLVAIVDTKNLTDLTGF